ncbi:hypothetical protein Tco_0413684 [Tanacetum coccineum]
MRLESLEARIVVHEKNEAIYKENIAFLKYDVQVKDISIKELKNQLENALKEKDDLKLKLENFEPSSKNLTKLMNSQISSNVKTGLGYDSHVNESKVLDNVVDSVFDSHESDGDNNQVNDRFKKRLDDSVYKSKVTETIISKDSLDTSASETRNAFEFKKKACFVCGSLNHLIKDRNFYENKMVGKSVLNNEGKATGQREVRPIWNNAQRVNHQNKLTHPHPRRNFVPSTVITNSGKVPVNTAKQSFSRAAVSNSTTKDVNTTGKLDFEDVYFVKELKFNLFSVSQMCDKKNSVLFIETECLILSPDFKLLNESQILLKVPR